MHQVIFMPLVQVYLIKLDFFGGFAKFGSLRCSFSFASVLAKMLLC